MSSGEFEESFLTVAEVAELLRLNPQTVRNWIDAGSLPAVRVGRRVRIKRSDLDRILESGYRGTPPPASTIAGPSATDFWGGEPVGAVDQPAPEGRGPKAEDSHEGDAGATAPSPQAGAPQPNTPYEGSPHVDTRGPRTPGPDTSDTQSKPTTEEAP